MSEDDEKRLASIEMQLKTISKKPGVYVIYNRKNEIIYVGKAKNLITRLRNHFAPSSDFSKSRVIREQGVRIEVHEVSSEKEALLLEYNMIQEHQPFLNERWKDGKTYPYLEVTTGERFPRFQTTRERNNKDSIYLGPYSDVGAVKRSLKYALTMFPVADCKKEIHLGDSETWANTCIRRRTKQCFRPCEIEVDEGEYRENVDRVIQFIEGKTPEIAESLENKMQKASEELEFEQAAKYRDVIRSIRRTIQKQRVMMDGVEDMWVIADAKNKQEIGVAMQKIESGRIARQDAVAIEVKNLDKNQYPDFVINFIMTILGSFEHNKIDEKHKAILKTQNSKKIITQLEALGLEISNPSTDIHKQLIDMASSHAKKYLHRRVLLKKQKGLPTNQVADLQDLLEMPYPPFIIDTFDVSTLLGTNNVASCVRFKNGQPLKKGYRKFKIRTVEQQDDFASMEEVVYRRYRDVADGEDPKGLEVPDLIVIDGGSEQLKRAHRALSNLNLDIMVVGLAKKEEEIYLVGEKDPIQEDKTRPALLLLRRGRDEAHRFAVKYQKQLRQKAGLRSILDDIEGIGPKRKKQLLKRYRTISEIAKASSETLSETIGISRELSSRVIDESRRYMNRLEGETKPS